MKPLFRRPRFGWVLALLSWLTLLSVPGAVSAGQASAASERAALERQRQAVQAAFERELQTCQARFAVTACLDEAHERRRVADAPLREALLQLDARSRRERAVERQRAVTEKLRAAAVRRQAASAPGP
jgi:hypothetical protein